MRIEIENPIIFSYSVSGHGGDASGRISPIGLRQVLNGEIVTSPSDRKAIANILRAASKSPVAMAGIRTEMLNNKYPES